MAPCFRRCEITRGGAGHELLIRERGPEEIGKPRGDLAPVELRRALFAIEKLRRAKHRPDPLGDRGLRGLLRRCARLGGCLFRAPHELQDGLHVRDRHRSPPRTLGKRTQHLVCPGRGIGCVAKNRAMTRGRPLFVERAFDLGLVQADARRLEEDQMTPVTTLVGSLVSGKLLLVEQGVFVLFDECLNAVIAVRWTIRQRELRELPRLQPHAAFQPGGHIVGHIPERDGASVGRDDIAVAADERIADGILVRRVHADECAERHRQPMRLTRVDERSAAEHLLRVHVRISELRLGEDADGIPARHRHAIAQLFERHAAVTVFERLVGLRLAEGLRIPLPLGMPMTSRRFFEWRRERPGARLGLWLKMNCAAHDILRRGEVMPHQVARSHQLASVRGKTVRAVVIGKLGGRIAAAQIEMQQILQRAAVFRAVEPTQHRRFAHGLVLRKRGESGFKGQNRRLTLIVRGLLLIGRRHRAPLDLLQRTQPPGGGDIGHGIAE